MPHVTPEMIVAGIGRLDRKVSYTFVNPANKRRIRVMETVGPAGPIKVKRFNPAKGQRQASVKTITITTSMIERFAASVVEGRPVHMDSVLHGSHNTRSVFESLVAHMPEFFVTYPQGPTGQKVKHLVYLPKVAHPCGTLTEYVLGDEAFPKADAGDDPSDRTRQLHGASQDTSLRQHSRMQALLIPIGRALGAEVWIASNDVGVTGCDGRLGDLEGVVRDINTMEIAKLSGVPRAIRLIDVGFFTKGGKSIPVVFEVEHSTGYVRGMSRMRGLMDQLPDGLHVRYVIVAPDSEYDKVKELAQKEQFIPLNLHFLPYSELDYLGRHCEQRGLKGASMEFLDNFMRSLL